MIDTEATKRFMAAPWLTDVDPETKKAIAGALVEARAASGATLLAAGSTQRSPDVPDRGNRGDRSNLRHRPPRYHHPFDGAGRCLARPPFFNRNRQPSRSRPRRMSGCCRSTTRLTRRCGPPTRAPRKRSPWRSSACPVGTVRSYRQAFQRLSRQHADEPARKSEWAAFRARLFEETGPLGAAATFTYCRARAGAGPCEPDRFDPDAPSFDAASLRLGG